MLTVQSLTAELENLKAEQNRVTGLAVFIGMTKEDAAQYDERQQRIYKLYTGLVALRNSRP